MAEETKIKSSLFGYSKKAVEEALEKSIPKTTPKLPSLKQNCYRNRKKCNAADGNKMLQECNRELENKFSKTEESIEAIGTENAELKNNKASD